MAEDRAIQEPAPVVASQPRLPFPLQEGESVLVLARRHWIYLWPNVLFHLVLAIVPVIVLAVVLDAIDVDGGNVFWIVAAVWVLFWAVRAFLEWYRYHHDIWVITNQRLVDAYKQNPFNLRVASADLVNVQDMAVERRGILATVLNYGDVTCQTAGANESFTITGIPDPRAIQARLDKERDRERMRGSSPGSF